MSNNTLKNIKTIASLFGFGIVLFTGTIEAEVKLYAMVTTAVIVLAVNRLWFVEKVNTLAGLKKTWGCFFMLAFFIVLPALVFPQLLVTVDSKFVTNAEYSGAQKKQECPKDHGNSGNNPVVNITASCAQKYADQRSNWCCTFGLPSKQDVEFNSPVVPKLGCSSIAEFVIDNSGKDRLNLVIYQEHSTQPVTDDVADVCTSFRLKSSCSVLCAVFD